MFRVAILAIVVVIAAEVSVEGQIISNPVATSIPRKVVAYGYSVPPVTQFTTPPVITYRVPVATVYYPPAVPATRYVIPRTRTVYYPPTVSRRPVTVYYPPAPITRPYTSYYSGPSPTTGTYSPPTVVPSAPVYTPIAPVKPSCGCNGN